jgi:hypothetical protein
MISEFFYNIQIKYTYLIQIIQNSLNNFMIFYSK